MKPVRARSLYERLAAEISPRRAAARRAGRAISPARAGRSIAEDNDINALIAEKALRPPGLRDSCGPATARRRCVWRRLRTGRDAAVRPDPDGPADAGPRRLRGDPPPAAAEAAAGARPTPIVALTAERPRHGAPFPRGGGFDAFVIKPFEFGASRRDDRLRVCAPGARAWRGQFHERHNSFGRTVLLLSGDEAELWRSRSGADVCNRSRGANAPSVRFCIDFRVGSTLPGFSRRWPGRARSRRASPRPRKDVRRAQKLRYRVFFDEGGATPDPTARLIRRDVCRFDRVSRPLIVVDSAQTYRDGTPTDRRRLSPVASGRGRAEFRLLQRARIRRRSAGCAASGHALSRGRPRLHRASHRGKHVLELLWRGLWAYARHHRIDAMIGCASLPGADAVGPRGRRSHAVLRAAATRVARRRRVPGSRRRRRRERRVRRTGRPARALVRALPPLVKGYWRLGATFSPTPVGRSRLQHDRSFRGHAACRDRRPLPAVFRRRGDFAAGGVKEDVRVPGISMPPKFR